jgi:predicted nucleotidyltransferase
MDAPDHSSEHIIAALRAHDAELRGAGIRHLSLFGSVARGGAGDASDVDLAVELDPAAQVGLFRLMGLQRRLSEILGRSVDLVPEPAENPRLRQNIDRDRRRAF